MLSKQVLSLSLLYRKAQYGPMHGQLMVNSWSINYLADGLAPAVAVSLMPMLQATNFIMRPPPRMAKRLGSCHSLAFTHSFLH